MKTMEVLNEICGLALRTRRRRVVTIGALFALSGILYLLNPTSKAWGIPALGGGMLLPTLQEP